MDSDQRPADSPATQPAPDGGQRCGFCGAHEAIELGDRWLCESCYQTHGSCCTEFCED